MKASMGFRGRVVCAAAVVMAAGMASAVSAAIIIDDFTTGPQVLTDPTPGVGTEYATQTGLPTGNIVGGVRHLQLFGYAIPSSIEVGGGVMNLNSPNSTTYFTISYNANPGGHGAGAMLNLDLTGMDRFEVTFSRVDRPVYFQLWIRSNNQTVSAGRTAEAPGVVEIPLSSYTSPLINWAKIDMVYLSIMTSRIYDGSGPHTESISDIRVVPEPATMALLALGGLVMFRRRL